MADLREQLISYLADAHSIEEQALVQMRRAPDIAGDEELARIFRAHETETEEHERLVRERLEALGASPSKLKDLVMRAGGAGFGAFAALNPDTPGKLTAHAYSYEHLELASYELLSRVAQRAGDEETVAVARRIRDQEGQMGERLEACFDRAVDASLRAGGDDLPDRLTEYLADAHALETQALGLLDKGPELVEDPEIASVMEQHLRETKEHRRLVAERLEQLGASPSRLKDAAMKLGALNWGTFFKAHPDTPGKLTAFAYAFEHLEIGGYELLKRVAQRAGDGETAALADRILAQERAAAEKIAGTWDQAVEASLS